MKKPFNVWKDVYMVGGAEISHPYDCCVYLVDVGELVLIDAGAGQSSDRLIENIGSLGFVPERLHSVIVTHAHIDHIGGLAYLRKNYGVAVVAHVLDAKAIESGKGVGVEFYGVDYQPCQVDVKLGSEDSLKFSKHEIRVVHVPGHTPGSIALYIDMEKRVLFGQDIHGPYHVAWGADPNKATGSLQRLLDLRADILCEGHFGVYQPATEVTRYIEGYLSQLQATTREKK